MKDGFIVRIVNGIAIGIAANKGLTRILALV